MPLLFMVVAALLVFIAVMVLLAIAAASEYGQLQRIRFDPGAKPFVLSLDDAFDPNHAVLWSTQVPALQLIASAGAAGVPYNRLYAAYQKTAEAFPELYDGSSFAQWLSCLQRANLITLASHRVKITSYGRDFLWYCLETAIPA
jgi:hypothetical protein